MHYQLPGENQTVISPFCIFSVPKINTPQPLERDNVKFNYKEFTEHAFGLTFLEVLEIQGLISHDP